MPPSPKKQSETHWTLKRPLTTLKYASDNLYWNRYATSPRHHALMDKSTHKPATLSIVIRNIKDNMGLVRNPPKDMKTRNLKLWCVGNKPEFTGAERYWEASMDELKKQMGLFCKDPSFAFAVDGHSPRLQSFTVDDTLKFQHPMMGGIYGIDTDELYTAFVQNLPKAYKKIRRGPIKPLPAYNLTGDVIHPHDYKNALSNATLEVVFTLNHFHFDHPEKSHSFIARPVEIRMVDSSSLPYSLDLDVPNDPNDSSDSSSDEGYDGPVSRAAFAAFYRRVPFRSPSPALSFPHYLSLSMKRPHSPEPVVEMSDVKKQEDDHDGSPFKRTRLEPASSSVKVETSVSQTVHAWRSRYTVINPQ